jgi:hypothetical protein
MEPTQCSETSAFNTQTPGKYPEDKLSLQQHGESLKTRRIKLYNTLDLPVLLYGSETWTIKARDAKRITAAEMK